MREGGSGTAKDDPDTVIARIAARQHGVVSRRQLIAAGVAGHRVDWRVRRGRVRVLHRGVYLIGPVEPPRAREMAAVLACGPAAVASHVSAGALWAQLGDGRAAPGRPHVVAPEGDHRRPGLRVHRIATLRRDEVTRLDGIPVTTPARTLLDLAGMLSARELERALAETLARGLARPAAIRKVLDRHPGSSGAGVLRALLDIGTPALTRSEAEERFLLLVREASLPPPRVNHRLEGLEVDFFWPAERLVIEVDGHAFHGTWTRHRARPSPRRPARCRGLSRPPVHCPADRRRARRHRRRPRRGAGEGLTPRSRPVDQPGRGSRRGGRCPRRGASRAAT